MAAKTSVNTVEPNPTESTEEDWTISFRLKLLHGRAPSAAHRKLIRTSLGDTCPVVACDAGYLVITMDTTGTQQAALNRGTAALWNALEAVAVDMPIVSVTLASHHDLDEAFDAQVPVTYLGVTECAARLGVTKQRISQLLETAAFPQPVAYVGTRPAWRKADIDAFAARRRAGQGRPHRARRK